MEIMKRVVLFLLFVSQGIFIARSQNVIKLQGDRQVEGPFYGSGVKRIRFFIGLRRLIRIQCCCSFLDGRYGIFLMRKIVR